MKSPEERKEGFIRVRVSKEQRAILQAGANAAGLELSSWLRFIGLREAKTLLPPEVLARLMTPEPEAAPTSPRKRGGK